MTDKCLLLASIPKSGTNLFRISFFNYLCHVQGDSAQKTYDDVSAAFPNQAKNYKQTAVAAPGSFLLPEGFSDFVYGHNPSAVGALDGPIVGLYRNPLDQIISAYHYFYVDRKNPGRHVSHPREILEERIDDFSRAYKTLMRLHAAGRALLMSYEDLFENSADSILRAADHYGMIRNREAAELAAKHSAIKAVQEFEKKVGYLHSTKRQQAERTFNPEAKFVRNGSIGQWQEWFSDAEVDFTMSKLLKNGIDPKIFRFKPAIQGELSRA